MNSDFVAASSSSPSASSPASGKRDFQPVAGEGATTGQPFPLPRVTTIERIHRERGQRFSDEIARGRPNASATIHSILERKPVDLYIGLASNDRGELPSDPALGGRLGLAIMVLVAALIGVMLASGGVL